MTDYDHLSELIRQALIKRLARGEDGQRFAMVCLGALVKTDKLAELFFPETRDV